MGFEENTKQNAKGMLRFSEENTKQNTKEQLGFLGKCKAKYKGNANVFNENTKKIQRKC